MIKLLRAAPLAAAFLALSQVIAPAHAQTAAPAPLGIGAPMTQTTAPVPTAPTTTTPATAAASAAAPVAAAVVAAVPMGLDQLVASFTPTTPPDETAECLAKAVYFEARGESLEGQLAVAEVVLNRAASGVYPADVCGVITQKAQFSFIRNGTFPEPNTASASWRKALAISHIARNNLARAVAPTVMWYHANYVAPTWGRFHTEVARIGAHIFYS